MIKHPPSTIQFLRPLDQLMKSFVSSDGKYFCQLFQRKKELIENLLSIGIDPQKYFDLVTKIYKSESELKSFAREDLLILRDKHKMNKQAWFEEIVGQTQRALTEQQAKYNQIFIQLSEQQQKSTKQQLPQQQKPQISSSPSPATNINITEFTNLKLFDEFMNKYYETSHKQTFMEIYEKKQRILEALETKKLPSDTYLKMSQKVFAQTKNEEIKKVLKGDLEMLSDLHDNNVNEWVKEALKQAREEMPRQKETYEMHKKGQVVHKRQPKVQLDIDNFGQIPIPAVDPSECISFLILDRYMKQSKSNPQLYITLYQKKQKLLLQLQEKKLTDKIYQQYLKAMVKKVQNDDLREIYQSELNDIEDLYERKTKQWFQNIVEETNVSSMMQEDLYHKFKKEFKPNVIEKVKNQMPVKKEETKVVKKVEQQKASEQSSTIDPTLGYDPSKVYSLKVLESAILAHQKDPKLFVKLFTQKNRIIDMMKNGQLDAGKYKALQEKMLKQFANKQFLINKFSDELKDEIDFDLQGIQDFHDGDVDKWFEEVVENAGMAYELQLAKYNELTKNNSNSSSSNTQPQVKKSKQPVQEQPQLTKKPVPQLEEPQSQQEQIPTPFPIDKVYSLKVLDTSLTDHESNPKLYMKIFAQKKNIFTKMEKGEIDAQKYKELQEKCMKEFAKNDDIKDAIEFDLADIEDLHDGDVGKWFEEVVNSAGTGYDNQLEKYMGLCEKYGKQKGSSKQASTSKQPSLSPLHHHQHYESPQKQFQSKLSEASNQINQSTPKTKTRFYLHEMAAWESLAKYYEKHNLDTNRNQLLKIYCNVSRHEVEDIVEKIRDEQGFDVVSYCKKFFPPITEAVFYQGTQNFEERLRSGVVACTKEIEQLKEYARNLRKNLNTKNLQKVQQKITEAQENIKFLTDLPVSMKKSGKLIPLPLIEEVPVSYPNMDQFTNLEANEVELKITKIEGLKGEHTLKIFFEGQNKFQSKLKNGPQNIVVKGKEESPQSFMKILKGDTKSFSISLYEIGWFSNSKVGQESLEMLFIRSNIHEGKVTVGSATFFYQARVRIAKNPMLTEIKQIKITKYPAYEYSKEVEEDLMAKFSTSSKLK